MTVFVDTNVVIALLDDKDKFHDWARLTVARLKAESPPLIIPDIVYCEVSVAMKHQGEMDEAIAGLGFERLPPTNAALFRAGKAFKKYRDVNKGPKLGVLPDHIIGAMVEVLNVPLLTANPKDFVKYFDNLNVILPPELPALPLAAVGPHDPAGAPA